MCLDAIDRKITTDITHGYKVFRIINGMILGEYYNPDGTYSHETPVPYETDKWYEIKDYFINKNEQHIRYVFKEGVEAPRDTYDFVCNKAFKVKIDNIIALYPYMRYPAGFHTFLYKEDAEKLK